MIRLEPLVPEDDVHPKVPVPRLELSAVRSLIRIVLGLRSIIFATSPERDSRHQNKWPLQALRRMAPCRRLRRRRSAEPKAYHRA